jgi:hypothetical protein
VVWDLHVCSAPCREYFDRSTGQWVRNTKLFIEKVGGWLGSVWKSRGC